MNPRGLRDRNDAIHLGRGGAWELMIGIQYLGRQMSSSTSQDHIFHVQTDIRFLLRNFGKILENQDFSDIMVPGLRVSRTTNLRLEFMRKATIGFCTWPMCRTLPHSCMFSSVYYHVTLALHYLFESTENPYFTFRRQKR